MDSKGKPFIFMLSVKKQPMMAVCKVAITSGYTADQILNSSLFHRNSVHIIYINALHLYFMLLFIFLSAPYDSTV